MVTLTLSIVSIVLLHALAGVLYNSLFSNVSVSLSLSLSAWQNQKKRKIPFSHSFLKTHLHLLSFSLPSPLVFSDYPLLKRSKKLPLPPPHGRDGAILWLWGATTPPKIWKKKKKVYTIFIDLLIWFNKIVLLAPLNNINPIKIKPNNKITNAKVEKFITIN